MHIDYLFKTRKRQKLEGRARGGVRAAARRGRWAAGAAPRGKIYNCVYAYIIVNVDIDM